MVLVGTAVEKKEMKIWNKSWGERKELCVGAGNGYRGRRKREQMLEGASRVAFGWGVSACFGRGRKGFSCVGFKNSGRGRAAALVF